MAMSHLGPLVGRTETWASPVWGQRGGWADGEDAPRVGTSARKCGPQAARDRRLANLFYPRRPPAPHRRAGANSTPKPVRAGGTHHYAIWCATGAGACSKLRTTGDGGNSLLMSSCVSARLTRKSTYQSFLALPNLAAAPAGKRGAIDASHLALVARATRKGILHPLYQLARTGPR